MPLTSCKKVTLTRLLLFCLPLVCSIQGLTYPQLYCTSSKLHCTYCTSTILYIQLDEIHTKPSVYILYMQLDDTYSRSSCNVVGASQNLLAPSSYCGNENQSELGRPSHLPLRCFSNHGPIACQQINSCLPHWHTIATRFIGISASICRARNRNRNCSWGHLLLVLSNRVARQENLRRLFSLHVVSRLSLSLEMTPY